MLSTNQISKPVNTEQDTIKGFEDWIMHFVIEKENDADAAWDSLCKFTLLTAVLFVTVRYEPLHQCISTCGNQIHQPACINIGA